MARACRPYDLALTTNSTAGPRLREALVARLRESGLDVGHYALPAPVPVPGSAQSAPLADCLGTYAHGDLELMVVRDGSGDLFVAKDRERDALPIVGRFLRERPGGPVAMRGR